MPLDPDAVLLTDRVAIVTGAAVGIGRATALALARFGAHLAVCDRDVDNMASLATDIEATRFASSSPRRPSSSAPSTCSSTTPVADSTPRFST